MTEKTKAEMLIETHMGHLNGRLDKFDELFGKVFDRQDEMAKILERNTVTVEEHQKRSTHLEKIVDAMKSALESLADKFSFLEKEVEEVKEDMSPIKDHVKEVSSILHFFVWMPRIVKGVILIFTFVTAFYGVVSIVKDFTPSEKIEKTK